MTPDDALPAPPVARTAPLAPAPARRPGPRDVAAISAVLAHVAGLSRDEAAARVEAALEGGDRHLVLHDA